MSVSRLRLKSLISVLIKLFAVLNSWLFFGFGSAFISASYELTCFITAAIQPLQLRSISVTARLKQSSQRAGMRTSILLRVVT